MRIGTWSALSITAIITSTSVAVAQNAKLVDWPSGDVWISEPESQAPSRTGKAGAVPEIPPSIVMTDGQNAVPTEFNFNITLTLRRNDRHRVHAVRPRHAAQLAHGGSHNKFRPGNCRG
jgi:hypothetical protein